MTTARSWLVAGRALVDPFDPGELIPQRGSRYGDTVMAPVFNKANGIADDGSYFIATNPTPGTGITTTSNVTTFADTTPYLALTNTASPYNASTSRRVYLDYLRLQCTVAGTGGTSLRFAIKCDVITTRATGGTVLRPQNVNQDSGNVSQCRVVAGTLVGTAASSGARLYSAGLLRSVIPVVGDTYVINFGGHDPKPGALAINGTNVSNVVYNVAPVCVGPGQCVLIHLWLAGQTVGSAYEVELGYVER